MAEDKYVDKWPPISGEYAVGDPNSQIAVVTLASHLDEQRIAQRAAIVGTCKTENIGIEKVIANIVSNCNIRYLVVCGAEVHGHLTGDAILNIHKNGIDDTGRIIDAIGAIPFISNLPQDAIDRFRDQVELVNLMNVEDLEQIEAAIDKCESKDPYPEEPMLVKLGGAAEETMEGVLALTPEIVSIESRVRAIEQEYKDLGKLQKFMAGLNAGLYQGFVLGLILTVVIFGLRRLIG
jgi:tetrahydromethanopterin S-methyltransferase subunit A